MDRRLRILILAVLTITVLALPVTAPPRSYWGYVYVDYNSIDYTATVEVWGNCYDNGTQVITSTTTQFGIGYYDLNIPMDESTTPDVDEGCELTDQINFTIDGVLTYQPKPGVWTVGDQGSDGSRVDLYAVGPFYLIKPANQSITTNRTPFFSWTHGTNNNFTYNLVIDNESSFAAPRVRNITNITSLNYTLAASENLSSDGRYYWRIDVLLNSQKNGTSHMFYFDLDTTPPVITGISPSNNSWQTSRSVSVTVTTDSDATCRYERNAGIDFDSKSYSMSGSGTSHSATISMTNDGNNSLYFQCRDSVGNTMQLSEEKYWNIRVDTKGPDTSGASVTINNGDTYSNSTTLNVTWNGFSDPLCPDNCSGINMYYYNTINVFSSATSTNSTSVTLSGVNQGTATVYVWADDKAGNTGGPVSDSIIVDSEPPAFSNWEHSPDPMNNSHSGVLNVSVDISDSVTGLGSDMPQISYKRGSYDSSYSQYYDMSSAGGSTYYYEIPEPASGWVSITDENVEYVVKAKDILNNTAISTVQKINISSENAIPKWIQPSDQTAYEDSTFSMIVEARDDGDTLSFSVNDSDFTVVSINSTAANVTWIPTQEDVGSRNVYFTVSDGYNSVNSNTITITVLNTNDAPEFPVIDDQTGYEHEEFYLNASASDDDGDNLTYSDNSPYFDIDLNTGIINFTPLMNARGKHNITLTVTDGIATDTVNFTLTIYYCGDDICNVQESCSSCSVDCGVCDGKSLDKMAIVIDERNCLNDKFDVRVYQLYSRATCPTMGKIVSGYEICGALADVGVSIYIKNPGGYEKEEDQWNLTGEYSTDENGSVSFIPRKRGIYRIIAKKSGYPDAYEQAEVDECYREEKVNETAAPEKKREEVEKPKKEEKKPEQPELEQPSIITGEESSSMLFVIYYIIIPIIVLSLFSVGTYYYQTEKDNNKYLLLMRIWWKKHTKLVRLYLEYYYHELQNMLKGRGKK